MIEDTPQQVNDYNCGVYVLALAELFIEQSYSEGSSHLLHTKTAINAITPQTVTLFRQHIRRTLTQKFLDSVATTSKKKEEGKKQGKKQEKQTNQSTDEVTWKKKEEKKKRFLQK